MRGVSEQRQLAKAERDEEIARLGRLGYRTGSIGRMVGVGAETAAAVLAEAGVASVHAKLGNSRHVQMDRVMEGVVLAAMPEEVALGVLKAGWDELDRDRFVEWDAHLARAVRKLQTLRARLNSREVPHASSSGTQAGTNGGRGGGAAADAGESPAMGAGG